jgi:hypothetical protein
MWTIVVSHLQHNDRRTIIESKPGEIQIIKSLQGKFLLIIFKAKRDQYLHTWYKIPTQYIQITLPSMCHDIKHLEIYH